MAAACEFAFFTAFSFGNPYDIVRFSPVSRAAEHRNRVYLGIIDNSLLDPAYIDQLQPSTLIGNLYVDSSPGITQAVHLRCPFSSYPHTWDHGDSAHADGIFPNVNIPVVTVIWGYTGLSPEQMGDRIDSVFERAVTTTVDNIEHLETQAVTGISVTKIYFHPGVNVEAGVAQVTAISQTMLRQFPPGTLPSADHHLQRLLGAGVGPGTFRKGTQPATAVRSGHQFLRPQLATVQGASSPWPYGGKQPQVQVDIDSAKLQAMHLSPADVVQAFAKQNLILPAGTEKIGEFEYQIETNSAPRTIEGLNNIPIKTINGATVYVRDVAHVRNGFPPQTNILRVNGQRAALMTIEKTGDVSTLDLVAHVRRILPRIKSTLPPQLVIRPVNNQSIFVRAAINDVVVEAIIAACLTAIMILVFLGSWRSTLIIAVSIPLSVLVSFIVLSSLGQTINIMTLGGLALAVGILVDDATVEIENINRNLEMGKEVEQAILDGAAEIAVPAFVSTLSICIVFVPMFFLGGVAKFLFVPLGEAVVFAMLASYFLSRTIVPTMAKKMPHPHEEGDQERRRHSRNPLVNLQMRFEDRFERIRLGYREILVVCLHHRGLFLAGFLPGVRSFHRICSRGWARIFSRRAMQASSSCMCAPTPVLALKTPRRFAIAWIRRFGRPFPRTSWGRSSITSGYRIAESIFPTVTPEPAVRGTQISL